jgi:hypothetical protein
VSDQSLALVAILGAGAAGAGGVLAASGRGVERPDVWYRLLWPREVESDAVVAFFRHLAGDRRRHVLALEVVASGGRLSYRIGIAERQSEPVFAALASYLPGVGAEIIEHDIVHAPNFAWRVALSSPRRALRTNAPADVARSLTTSLAAASTRYDVIFQLLLGERLRPASAPAKGGPPPTASWGDLLRQTVSGKTALSAEEQRAMKDKIEQPGFRTTCRIGVSAPSARMAQAAASQALAALRTAEAPGVHIKLVRDDPDKLAAARPPRSWPVAVNVSELAALCGWPLGGQPYPGVARSAAHLLPASEAIAREGRIIGLSTYPGAEQRKLALRVQDSLQHLHVIGPTGVGKSTLLLNLLVQDFAAGRGALLLDAKGDLVEQALLRVPEARRDDIVVLDFSDKRRPVGLNILSRAGRPPELIADQVLAVFHDLYRENWGPRTADIMHAALLSIAGRPGMTLCALPVLLSNEHFRRKMVAGVTDEVALRPFWSWFEELSEGERQQAIAPVMNKLRAVLLNPRVRAVIGQPEPAFDIHSVFRDGKVLLCSLSEGVIGPEATGLVGSLVLNAAWQAALDRIRLPESKRTPVSVYADEFQRFAHLPTDFADVLAQARGLGVSLVLAHQHLTQLPAGLRSAVLSNARSRICFQQASEDARLIAATSEELQASDLQSLGRYEIYASLVAHGNVTPFASARTLEPCAPRSDAQATREASRQRYGRDLAEIEAQLAALVGTGAAEGKHPIGRRRQP